MKYVQTSHAHQYHEGNPRLELHLEMINDPSWEQRVDEIGDDVEDAARVSHGQNGPGSRAFSTWW